MKELMIIGYFTIVMLAIYFGTGVSYKFVSKCCQAEYREIPRKDSYAMYCLNCKKWCDLTEVKNIK